MKRVAAVLLSLTLLAGLAWQFRAPLAERLLERALPSQLARDAGEELGEGLHLVLCGAGGPLPDPRRSGPCVMVIAGDKRMVIDAGQDSARNLLSLNLAPGSIDAVLLSHFHSDHIDGLGELAMQRWVGAGHREPLPVYGPTGVEEVVAGFNRAYAADAVYRQAHHGDSVAPLSGAGMRALAFILPPPGETRTVMQHQDLRVEAFAVDHAPVSPAVGYRFHYRGRSLLVSGDTSASPTLQALADGVDLLVHEALAPHMVARLGEAATQVGNQRLARIARDIPDYHTSPVDAARIARAADVGHLLFYHVVPPTPLPGSQALWARGVAEIFPDFTVGEDGTMISLPPESSRIERH